MTTTTTTPPAAPAPTSSTSSSAASSPIWAPWHTPPAWCSVTSSACIGRSQISVLRRRPSSPDARAATPATCANGCAPKRRVATPTTTRRRADSTSTPPRRCASPTTPTLRSWRVAWRWYRRCTRTNRKVTDRFVTGEGLGWHEHHHDLFHGTERLFKPLYVANLVSAWIPALDGVEDKLAEGGPCRRPRLRPRGVDDPARRDVPDIDDHRLRLPPGSIEIARKRAAEAGSPTACASRCLRPGLPRRRYDLVCIFDALHDMGDPTRRARHIRRARSPPTAPGCSSSRWPAIGSRTTSTPSGGSSTRRRRSSARRPRGPRTAASPRRPGRTRSAAPGHRAGRFHSIP